MAIAIEEYKGDILLYGPKSWNRNTFMTGILKKYKYVPIQPAS